MVLRIAADNDECRDNIQSYLVKHGHKFTKQDDNNFILAIDDKDIAFKLLRSLHKDVGTKFVPLFNEHIVTWCF